MTKLDMVLLPSLKVSTSRDTEQSLMPAAEQLPCSPEPPCCG